MSKSSKITQKSNIAYSLNVTGITIIICFLSFISQQQQQKNITKKKQTNKMHRLVHHGHNKCTNLFDKNHLNTSVSTPALFG